MDNSKIIGLNNPQQAPGQAECIELLEKALADAKAGKITTCGIVACGPVDFATAIAGPDAPRLFLGTGILGDTIKAACMAPRPGSPILRPGRR